MKKLLIVGFGILISSSMVEEITMIEESNFEFQEENVIALDFHQATLDEDYVFMINESPLLLLDANSDFYVNRKFGVKEHTFVDLISLSERPKSRIRGIHKIKEDYRLNYLLDRGPLIR